MWVYLDDLQLGVECGVLGVRVGVFRHLLELALQRLDDPLLLDQAVLQGLELLAQLGGEHLQLCQGFLATCGQAAGAGHLEVKVTQ